MTRPGSVRRISGAGILAAFALAGPAMQPERIAAADGGMVIATRVLSSLAADLDGDGAKEIVAVVADDDAASTLRVAAWGVRGGSWKALGDDVVRRWDADEGRPRAAHAGEEAAALFVIDRGGTPQVMVAVGVPNEDGTGPTCCLSLGRVRSLEGGLAFDVTPGDFGSVESVAVADLEADGDDELLVSTPIPTDEGAWPYVYTLLRQSDDGFAAEPIDLPDDENAYLTLAADTDGGPGDELIFMTENNDWLIRASATDAGVQLERAQTVDLFNRRSGGWIAGAADDALVFVSETGFATARWPAGEGLKAGGRQSAGTFPTIFVVGEGAAARIIEVVGLDATPDDELRFRVFDLGLELELELETRQEVNDLWRMTQNVEMLDGGFAAGYPQMGPIPGGLPDGRFGLMGLGHLLAMGPAGPDARDVAQLAGGDVIGLVGPDSAWLGMGSGWSGTGGSVWIGGLVGDPEQLAGSRVSVVRLDAVVDSVAGTDGDVTLAGATVVDSPDGPTLFTGPDGFRATIAGEPGTEVMTKVGQRATTAEIDDRPVTVHVDLSGRPDTNARDDIGLVVISPGGIVRTITWDVVILRHPPDVTAASSFDLFEGRAAVSGEVADGTSVTVDGRSVEPQPDGAYRIELDATPWPRDVVVVARDLIGQETVSHVELVGFVDLRVLPWVAITVALTIGAGILLFVRTPSIRPAARLVPDGDGRLEELDGDGV